ncbi:hypothetical protein [Flavobacterium lacisediminis]|uniref:Uncharacterized protein n=1 Tax=Flavobacterium lacisediminis TaxID=2989705 RepID=A0ABT3EJT6_9FLAO|nr:hypothetical protein [Flavobacterium lacisediminis]MCW1148837.1 hypothetical protein [Flavobacterium lacisediminis]
MKFDYCLIDRKSIHGMLLSGKMLKINKKLKIKRLKSVRKPFDCKIIYIIYDYSDFVDMSMNSLTCDNVLMVVINLDIIKENKLGPKMQFYTPDSLVAYLMSLEYEK